jgi:urease accessory protein
MPTVVTPPAAGTAYLRFERNGPETVLARSFATSPLKVLSVKRGRSAAWVYAATLGGGLVGGDAIQMTVEVMRDARALLTTQASTKVYRSRRPASQTISATIEAGALLAVVPDPIVCFASADFSQHQHYEMDRDASLVAVDWLTSGRHGAGERWAFSRYANRVVITREGRQIFNDALVLEPDLDSVSGRMDRFEVILTAVLTGPLVADAAEIIFSCVAEEPVERAADVVSTASRLRDGGTLLRMAGVSVEQVGRTLRDSLSFLSPLLDDDPWSRKW